jgi:hypothetical protein
MKTVSAEIASASISTLKRVLALSRFRSEKYGATFSERVPEVRAQQPRDYT